MQRLTAAFLALGIPTTFQVDEQRDVIKRLDDEQKALIAAIGDDEQPF